MRRPDYQNLTDNLEEITDKRNAEIRTWGKKQLADSDSVQVHSNGDWDLISTPEEIVVLPPEI